MSLVTPARKNVLADGAKVQRVTQGSENTTLMELAGATASAAPTDSIFV
ncbi:hypothetical protein [Bradyrhizobium sp. 141]|nr:hypothetical protein [Bradyrhizobium sp. 141]MCK1721081.1 hypothetical protein [Bradyrhizobium sp. 141]